MNDQSLSRFEAQLERLIEGAFAQLFSKTISAHDIALHLARAMEADLQPGTDGDVRPFAADQYSIRMNPDVQEQLIKRQPSLESILGEHIVELASQSGWRLNQTPLISIIADPALDSNELSVFTSHGAMKRNATAVMQRIETPKPDPLPTNPQLIVNGQRVIPLSQPIVNIGRGRDNHIVLDDPYTSRHHAQLRLRFGRYTLFDTHSQGGVMVNDVLVREHRLQSGDVIRLGKTQIVYLEDTTPAETGSSEPFDL